MTREELRALTPEQRFEQFLMLMAAAPRSRRTAAEEAEILRVRQLWVRLHERYGTMPQSR